MDALSQSLIRTISFYDAIGKVPLTKVELYKYLIRTENLPKMSFGDFCESLEQHYTEISPHTSRYRGFYFLKKNKGAYKKRMDEGKTSIEKWRIAQRMAKVISFLPYVRMVVVTGSLAQNSTTRESDIDMLIAARGGRIWTTRMLVSVAMHIIGKRRHGNKIRDRICLNHYITDTALALRPKHLFSAHICSSFVHLWSKNKTQNLFTRANIGLMDRHLSQHREKQIHLKSLPVGSRFFCVLPSILEIILGDRTELLIKKVQTDKIRRSIKRKDAREPGLAEASRGGQEVIFGNSALVFHHPRPQNQEALFLYKKNLEEIGAI